MITDEIFQAFLDCETKSFLQGSGAIGDRREFSNWKRSLAIEHMRKCCIGLRSLFREDEWLSGVPLTQILDDAKCRLAIDCFAQSSDVQSHIHALERLTASGKTWPLAYVPIRFVHHEKITRYDKLLLAFDALAISGNDNKITSVGKIIYGSKQTAVIVKVDALIEETQAIVRRISAQQSSQISPQLILNKHCPECEFQRRCHQIAIEKDELSLLSGMSGTERKKQHDKGIFTVSQLSYTFHARRKPKQSSSNPEKYNHALRARAIRDQKIYISGSPDLRIQGNAVYFDVEGIPDRDSYYLIGIRVRSGDAYVQYSFWSDEEEGEKAIWISFLEFLATIENPQLIHYGNYEKKFLTRMKHRYPNILGNSVLVDRLISESVNVLSVIYGQVYFPTYSNGLKENAHYLGFRWTDINPSGVNALVLRYDWELSKDIDRKTSTIRYNAEDCEALERITVFLVQLYERSLSGTTPKQNNVVHTDSLSRDLPYRFGKREFPIPELEFINHAAYWDRDRDQVHVGVNKVITQRVPKRRRHARDDLPLDQQIRVPPPICCPRCNTKDIRRHDVRSRIIYDMKVEEAGIHRSIVKYIFERFFCRECGAIFVSPNKSWTSNKYGWELLAYSIYQIIDLQIPQRTVVRSLNQLFKFSMAASTLHSLKTRAATYYRESYDRILDKIVCGKLIHVDESRVETEGKSGYGWVMANIDGVIYFYTETREGQRIRSILKDFKGVLISDFYSVYDSIDCKHQRCLIHLIRDLNDSILLEPFNSELKTLAQKFGDLLKPMIQTAVQYGLKSDRLSQYRPRVDEFYRELDGRDISSDIVIKYKRRMDKHRVELFTFLDYDDVPWNNNLAERAIKTFARLRRVIGGVSSQKGIQDYLVLLSVSETCKAMRISFLEFLRSQEKDVARFREMP